MTKEQFIKSWSGRSDLFKKDLEAVIATEVEKVQEAKHEEAKPQPDFNPIEEAYEQGLKIRQKNWLKSCWIKKHSETETIDERGNICYNDWSFVKHPNKWELYTEPTEQPDFNPIEQAYERGEKIRHKNWLNGDWIQKHKETKTINNYGHINSVNPFAFIQYPEQWELYTEPDQVTDQVQTANSFDKERFEAMFRAVVASGVKLDFEYCKRETTYFIQKLDAYCASKEGGNNE